MPVDTLGALRSHWRYKDFNPVEERNQKLILSRSLKFDYTRRYNQEVKVLELAKL